MKRKIFIFILIFLVLIAGIIFSLSSSKRKEIADIDVNQSKKPVILLVVDSLMTEPLQKAIQQGKAPAFSYLIKNGKLYPDIVSSYPTMSVTIDSTLLTGTYADTHHIPGLIWFKEDENRIVSYGSGISEMWNNGITNVAIDSVVNLNEKHLNKEIQTIYEELYERNIQSASINGLLHRGNIEQQLSVPKAISTLQLLPDDLNVTGPTLLSLGALSQYSPKNNFQKFIWDRFGIDNKFSVNELKYLIDQEKLPSFTLVYLPDADATIHRKGPDDLKGIMKADNALEEIFNSYPSWEEAIEENIWMVLGDSSQSKIKDDKKTSLIDLNELLKDYTFWERKNVDGQLAIAINERMAYINLNDEQVDAQKVINTLKKDERIGFIAWKDDSTNYVVAPKSNEPFTFSPNGSYKDQYNQTWDIRGNREILDLTIKDETIYYKSYPDALARLNGALHSHNGRFILVDAKPHYEFIEKHSHDHADGGAHGSLHEIDSIVPLIVVGTSEKPKYNRIVDIKQWILQIMQ